MRGLPRLVILTTLLLPLQTHATGGSACTPFAGCIRLSSTASVIDNRGAKVEYAYSSPAGRTLVIAYFTKQLTCAQTKLQQSNLDQTTRKRLTSRVGSLERTLAFLKQAR